MCLNRSFEIFLFWWSWRNSFGAAQERHMCFNHRLSKVDGFNWALAPYIQSFLHLYIKMATSATIESLVSLVLYLKLFDHFFSQFCLGTVVIIINQHHAFIQSRSTGTNLFIYQQYLLSASERFVQVDRVYTDFSKAQESHKSYTLAPFFQYIH